MGFSKSRFQVKKPVYSGHPGKIRNPRLAGGQSAKASGVTMLEGLWAEDGTHALLRPSSGVLTRIPDGWGFESGPRQRPRKQNAFWAQM